jgi:Peptidase A4 family
LLRNRCRVSSRTLTVSLPALGALAVLIVPALAAPAAARAEAGGQASVSTNWAGYVASPLPSAGSRFRDVSGSWRVPSVKCTAGHEADSAVWVGLGGYSERSRALEQVGSDADCTRSGQAVYYSWYELLPAAPVSLKLRVRPGDELAASVTVAGQDVTLRIRDLSTGGRFAKTRRMGVIDASSAEWIVEAPSVCPNASTCAILPLADFGQVAFTDATAAAGSHAGPVSDAGWVAVSLELRQHAFNGFHRRAPVAETPTRTLTEAAPSASAAPSGAFSVSWQQSSQQLDAASSPTLPGFGGAPP